MKRVSEKDKATQSEQQTPLSESNEATPSRGTRRDSNEIAVRAYEKFEARGYAEGGDLEDWLAAERELNDARGTGDVE